MIELFDAERLLPRRDHSLLWAIAAVLLLGGGVGTWGWSLHTRLADLERERAVVAQRLQKLGSQTAPSTALLADLQREAEKFEFEAQAGQSAPGADQAPRPSQWMARMADLGSNDISLSLIDIDRSGNVRLEGMATSAQAVSQLLQRWDRTQSQANPVPARAIDVRHEPAAAGLLQFKVRASATSAAPAPSLPRT